MPIYQMEKTYKSGFYDNWKDVNGQDMRVYTAQDMRKPYDVVFSDGIMPEADGTPGNMLKVSLLADMQISISKGHAKVGGAWFENTAPFKITLDAAESTTRYDCIIVRNDDTERVAEASIYVKSLYSVPTVANMVRTDKIYELCLAYVEVPAFAETLTAENIIDTRTDGNLCNVMRGVGATVIRAYQNTYFTEAENQTEIPIGISQYDRMRDALTVMVEGRIMTAGANYTISDNEKIVFNIGFPVIGTKIDFEVAKNVNAAGAETVIQEVVGLRKEVTATNKMLEHHYYCNAVNDNFKIAEIYQQFMTGGDYKTMRLIIHGTFRAVEYMSGTGGMHDPFVWFNLIATNNTRRVILDFSDCSQIDIPIVEGKYNAVFFGDVRIEGATVIANNVTTGTAVVAFEGKKKYHAKDCRFYLNGGQHSYIAKNGTFENCRGSVANARYYSSCFYTTDDNLIRVIGGEYYAYRGDSSNCGVVIHAGATAVTILYGVNCPTLARSGYSQQWAISQTNDDGTGVLSCTDLISTLPLDVVSGLSNIRGTIPLNKLDTM